MADPFVATVPSWAEAEGSPAEKFEQGSLNVTQVLTCDWAERYTLRDLLLNANNGLGYIYPHATPTAFCKKVGIAPITAASSQHADGWVVHEKARLTVEYRSPQILDPEDILLGGLQIPISEEIVPTIEAIPLPHDTLQWADDDKPISAAEAPTKQLFGMDYTQTHHNILATDVGVTYNVWAAVADLVGRTNDASVTTHFLQIIFTAGQLLCKPPVIRKSASGMVTFEYRFKADFGGWNRFWRPDIAGPVANTWGNWDHLHKVGTSENYRHFPLGDFSTISG